MPEAVLQIMQTLTDMEKRAFLGEAIIEENKQLQELARYPYKTAIRTSGTHVLIAHSIVYMLFTENCNC